jgi:hypothetical protein
MTLHRTDLETCRVGLLWIQRHRELHRQPTSPSIERAIEHIEKVLSMSACGPEGEAPEDNWITTRQYAERWGCSTRHARRIAPLIGGRKDGRDWLIPETAEGVT